MKAVSVAMLLLVGQEGVCDHGSRGAARPVNFKEMKRVHEEIARAFTAVTVPDASPVTMPGFDSGLPTCRARRSRTMRVDSLPAEMKPLYFAPAGSEVPAGSILVASRARSVADASFLAVPEVIGRLGVRCVPTRVRPAGPGEVEILEGER